MVYEPLGVPPKVGGGGVEVDLPPLPQALTARIGSKSKITPSSIPARCLRIPGSNQSPKKIPPKVRKAHTRLRLRRIDPVCACVARLTVAVTVAELLKST